MKIFVHAKPDAYEQKVEQLDATHYRVAVVEPPVKGRANLAITKALAAHFNVAPTSVRLVSGFSSKTKVFEIINNV